MELNLSSVTSLLTSKNNLINQLHFQSTNEETSTSKGRNNGSVLSKNTNQNHTTSSNLGIKNSMLPTIALAALLPVK